METKQDSKVSKPKPASVSTTAIRKKILHELAKANKKDFGRKLRAEDLIAVAITLVQPEHIKQLQEATLSNADRLEQQYKDYVAKHGNLSKDAFIGKLLNAEVALGKVEQVQSP
jgi:hypothetical protein